MYKQNSKHNSSVLSYFIQMSQQGLHNYMSFLLFALELKEAALLFIMMNVNTTNLVWALDNQHHSTAIAILAALECPWLIRVRWMMCSIRKTRTAKLIPKAENDKSADHVRQRQRFDPNKTFLIFHFELIHPWLLTHQLMKWTKPIIYSFLIITMLFL